MRGVTAEIRIAAKPADVLRAFLDLKALKQWWSVDRGLVEERPGGVWALAWERSDRGFRYVTVGIIHSYQAGEYLHIEKVLYFHPDYMIFGPMDLNVAVKTAGNGTLLTVRQDGYQSGPEWDWYYQAVLTAWPEAIKLVKKYCER
jgi:Activator of Hsp90 ATPase homolog 1-like protein